MTMWYFHVLGDILISHVVSDVWKDIHVSYVIHLFLLWHPHIFSNINRNLPSINLELRNIDVNENMTRFFETPHKTQVSYSDIYFQKSCTLFLNWLLISFIDYFKKNIIKSYTKK